ncbi:MAG: phosphatase PAP2 family protein [Bacteroidia bacterium]|nr:phosphatase PAP2 family protein [Bacteroidia bacterium]
MGYTSNPPEDLIEKLLEWDTQALLWINTNGMEPWDTIAWYGTKGWIGIPLYLVASGWLLWRKGKQGLRALAVIVAIIAATDLICARILKPGVGRLRPSHEPCLSGRLRLLHGYRGGLYSFPSNHAANTAAGSVAFALYIRHPLVWLIGALWTFLHSFTRVYLGVHYPSDILAGWIIGSLLSLVLLKVYQRRYA